MNFKKKENDEEHEPQQVSSGDKGEHYPACEGSPDLTGSGICVQGGQQFGEEIDHVGSLQYPDYSDLPGPPQSPAIPHVD
jgi:hypothetical protein